MTAPRVAAAVALGLLAAGCGGSPTSRGETHTTGALAFARCMRAHGVPAFPDPGAGGSFPAFAAGVSKRVSAAADDACRHLLPGGGTATPQQRRQKLAFALHVAGCLRAHGYSDFPDPSPTQGIRVPPGVDTRSARFQRVESACETAARKALGLP